MNICCINLNKCSDIDNPDIDMACTSALARCDLYNVAQCFRVQLKGHVLPVAVAITESLHSNIYYVNVYVSHFYHLLSSITM
jgi:hypothetical protein